MKALLGLSQIEKLELQNGAWPKNRLISGSEVNRNKERLTALFDQALRDGLENEALIEIGPGAVVERLSSFLRRPKGSRLSTKRLCFNAVRLFESWLRQNISSLRLTAFEPREIVQLLRNEGRGRIVGALIMVDRDKRVLEAAERSLIGVDDIEMRFEKFNLNEKHVWTGPRAALVCSYKCIHLCPDPARALEAILGMTKSGALVSTSYPITDARFEPIDQALGLYRVTHA